VVGILEKKGDNGGEVQDVTVAQLGTQQPYESPAIAG
jgi:hypothetical protein